MSDLLHRIAERARARRMRRSVRIAIAVGVVAVLVFGAWVVLASPWLTVRTIEVEGVSGAVAKAVEEAAEPELDTPLARVDVDALIDRVDDVPQVASVTVSRSWPHTLRLVVDRRTPAAYVPSGPGDASAPQTFDVVDRTGVVISTETERPANLPRVGAPRDDGGQLLGDRVADALTVLDAAPPKVRRKVDVVEARTPDDIRMTLSDGTEIHWGSAVDVARKATVLAALMKQDARVYDVSAPELPTTRN
jgi:cell division protein FtsQ